MIGGPQNDGPWRTGLLPLQERATDAQLMTMEIAYHAALGELKLHIMFTLGFR